MAKKQSIAQILMASKGYQKALGKLQGKVSNHLGIVETVTGLGIYEELVKIRTWLEGRPIESAKVVKHEETEAEENTRVDKEVEEANKKQEEADDNDNDDNDNDNNDNDNDDNDDDNDDNDNDDNDNDDNDDNDNDNDDDPPKKKVGKKKRTLKKGKKKGK